MREPNDLPDGVHRVVPANVVAMLFFAALCPADAIVMALLAAAVLGKWKKYVVNTRRHVDRLSQELCGSLPLLLCWA